MSSESPAPSQPTPASSPGKRRLLRFIIPAFAALVLVIGLIVLWAIRDKESDPLEHSDYPKNLRHTVFVPTLETPLPEDKSAIWCATLPLAWQQLEKDVAKGPIDLVGAEAISRSLRNTPDPGLDPADYYVAAGFYQDGILERIRRELPAKFPGVLLPKKRPPDFEEKALAYACLKVALRYEFEFNRKLHPLEFTNSRGQEKSVSAFGILEEDKGKGLNTYRGQVRVLFEKGEEFAIDLSRKTRPYQIVLARMKRQPTLKATLEDLEKRIAAAPASARRTVLGKEDWLLIPTMTWRINRPIPELEGKRLRGPSVPPDALMEQARQFIRFKIDWGGVEVSAETILDWQNGDEPKGFLFDKPYLLVLKRRDGKQPFFVMWVDNAELMQSMLK